LLGLVSKADHQAYKAYQDRLFDFIAAQSAKSIVVDSSKSAWRYIGRFTSLRRLAAKDVRVLHLVRDGLSVLESQVVIGDNLALQGLAPPPRWMSLRTILGWTVVNSFVRLLAWPSGPERYLRVKYEEFVLDPARILKRIGEFGGFDAAVLTERIGQDVEFAIGHGVGGNRIRHGRTVKLWREERASQGEQLKSYQRLLFRAIGGWLQRRYGYS
jgi:hypothetical protein